MVKIIIGGDICPTKEMKNLLSKENRQLFSDLLNEIQSSDLAIANLESPY